MRISTATNYILGGSNVSYQQALQSQMQTQLSTMKRVNTPSDDPVAASRILDIRQADGRNEQFIKNTNAADSALSFSDEAMQSTTELISQIKTLAIQAGSGQNSAANLKQIDAQLQGMFGQLIGAANQVDGNGQYLFSGTNSTTPPYVSQQVSNTSGGMTWDSWNVTYNGNDGQKTIPISSTRQVPVTDTGPSVFGSVGGGSLFDAVNTLHKALQLGTDTPGYNFTAALQSAIGGLDSAMTRVTTANAAVGSRMNETEATRNGNGDLSLAYAATLSKLEDLDLPKAVSDMAMAQLALQGSMAAFTKTQGLSLLNYL